MDAQVSLRVAHVRPAEGPAGPPANPDGAMVDRLGGDDMARPRMFGDKKTAPARAGAVTSAGRGGSMPRAESDAGLVSGVVVERHSGDAGDDCHRKSGGQSGTEQQGRETAAENEEKMKMCFHGW